MATLTPNYGLYKPAGSEFVNEETDLNDNWDIVDTQLKAVSDSVPLFTRAIKSADKTITNSTTFDPDNHLFLPVASNSIYILDSMLLYAGPADPAGGIKFDWTGPAGFTINWVNYGVLGVGTGTLTSYDAVMETAAGGRFHGTAGLPTTLSLQPKGVVRTLGTAGTLTLRWAQAAANATGTTLKTDSFIRLMKS